MSGKNRREGTPRMRRSISGKTLFCILITAMVLSGTSILIGYHVYANTMDQHYISNTVNLARTAVALLDADTVERCASEVYRIYSTLTPEEKENSGEAALPKFSHLKTDEGWLFMRSQMQKIARENDLKSVMIVTLDREAHTVIYVVDSDTNEETYCPPGTLDDSMTDEEIESFVRSTAVISNTEEFGWLSSGAAPIYSPDGSIHSLMIIDISMNDVMRDRYKFLFNYCGILLVAIAVLSAVMTWYMRRSVVTPINRLARAAEEYSYDQGNSGTDAPRTSHFADLKIHTGDEVENLASVMDGMETRLAEYIDNLTRVTAEKERIGAELNIATQIQADMLPRIFPPFPDRKEFDIYATMTPAKEVGGDFSEFFLLDEDHLGLVMADVSGKGVPAALFMVIAKTLIKNRAQMGGGPGEILEYVNGQLCEGNDAELFVTVWFAILNVKTGRGLAANAGHEHPALRRADGSFELVVYRHAPAVAVMPGVRFREHEFELHPGDTLFVYTDGVTEATSLNNELFGTDRMLTALNRDPDAEPAALLKNVRTDIDAFVGDAPQFDDITMMALLFSGTEGKNDG